MSLDCIILNMSEEKKKCVAKNSNLCSLNKEEGKKKTKFSNNKEESASKKGEEKKRNLPNKREEKKDKREWQVSLKDSRDRLTYLFTTRAKWDVKFTLVDENQKDYVFLAHAWYLIACSPVFELMIKNMQKNSKNEIPLTDIHPHVFHKLLKYLYTDEMNFANDEEVALLCEAAVNFKLPFLQTDCQKCLEKTPVGLENVIFLLNNAVIHNISTQKEKCLFFIKKNAKAVMEDVACVKLVEKALIAILNLPEIPIPSEDVVLKFVIQWAKYRSTDINIRDILPFFNYIHFNGMTARDFIYICDANGKLFDKPHALKILRYMARPKYGLRTWWELSNLKEKSTEETDAVETKSPTIEIASEYRLLPTRSDVQIITANEICDSIIIRCTRNTELVLGVKIKWLKLDGCTEVKVICDGFIMEPQSLTPIQNKNVTQQYQFGEENFIILSFESPFRMYYGCALHLYATLRFPKEATVAVTVDYAAVTHIIRVNRGLEPEDKQCAIFSEMYYTPPMKKWDD